MQASYTLGHVLLSVVHCWEWATECGQCCDAIFLLPPGSACASLQHHGIQSSTCMASLSAAGACMVFVAGCAQWHVFAAKWTVAQVLACSQRCT
jgi:hypothetical protein